MRTLLMGLFIVMLALSGLGCASIVAKDQTYAETVESGALKWSLAEVQQPDGRTVVWIPHWREGLCNISTPKATNAAEVDKLTYDANKKLVEVEELGRDRLKWFRSLWSSDVGFVTRVKKEQDALKGQQEFEILYDAIGENHTVQVGTPLEAVFFAQGFPMVSPDSNPRCRRTRAEISPTKDTLYYFASRFGSTVAVEIEDNKVVDIHDGPYLARIWRAYPTDLPKSW